MMTSLRVAIPFGVFIAAAASSPAAAAETAPLSLVQPLGGESWAAGSSHRILWKVDGLPPQAKVHAETSLDGGQSWQAIGEADASLGRLLWKVPADLPGSIGLRVTTPDGKLVAATKAPVAIVPSQEVPEYRWANVTMTAEWAPRDGAGALVYKDRLWFLGGWNPGDRKHFPLICNNEVWSSKDGAAWTLEKPNTFLNKSFDVESDWEGRHTAGYVVHQDRMWIVGGDCNQGHYQNDVWSSADGKSWSHVNKGKDVPWGPRALHYTVAFQDKIWVIGGQTMPGFAGGKEAFYRDCWTSTDGVAWEKIEPKEPCWTPRGMIGGAAVHNGRIWMLGGGTYDTPTTNYRNFHNDVWSTADGATWTRHVAEAPWNPRQYHDVAVYDGRLWVMEGYHKDGGNRKDVWYSQDGVNWYEVPNTPWNPRHAASVYVYDGSLWMVSGNNMQKDAWRLRRAAK